MASDAAILDAASLRPQDFKIARLSVSNLEASSESERLPVNRVTKVMMRKKLEREGMHFHPRTRELIVPLITEESSAEIADGLHISDKDARDKVIQRLLYMKNFLTGEAIEDNFPNHAERRRWRVKRLAERDGDVLNAVYCDPNQFRANNLMGIRFSLVGIIGTIDKTNPELAQTLDENLKAVEQTIGRLAEYDTRPIEQKINIIQKVENITAQSLHALAPHQLVEKIMVT